MDLREWAPNATALYLIGDHQLGYSRNIRSTTEINRLGNRTSSRNHLTRRPHKLQVFWPYGSGERIPAYTRRAVQDPQTHIFLLKSGILPHPTLKLSLPQKRIRDPLIYETHIGMAQDAKISTYTEFREHTLLASFKPDTTLSNLWALWNPYYGSFGYHVSNFCRLIKIRTPKSSNNSSTPLIKPVLPSSSTLFTPTPQNENEGLSRFDGTPYQYFHAGERGNHPAQTPAATMANPKSSTFFFPTPATGSTNSI